MFNILFCLVGAIGSKEVSVNPIGPLYRKTTDADNLLLTCEFPAKANTSVWGSPSGSVITANEVIVGILTRDRPISFS